MGSTTWNEIRPQKIRAYLLYKAPHKIQPLSRSQNRRNRRDKEAFQGHPDFRSTSGLKTTMVSTSKENSKEGGYSNRSPCTNHSLHLGSLLSTSKASLHSNSKACPCIWSSDLAQSFQ